MDVSLNRQEIGKFCREDLFFCGDAEGSGPVANREYQTLFTYHRNRHSLHKQGI